MQKNTAASVGAQRLGLVLLGKDDTPILAKDRNLAKLASVIHRLSVLRAQQARHNIAPNLAAEAQEFADLARWVGGER